MRATCVGDGHVMLSSRDGRRHPGEPLGVPHHVERDFVHVAATNRKDFHARQGGVAHADQVVVGRGRRRQAGPNLEVHVVRGVAPCGVVPNLHLVVSLGEGVVPRGGGLSVDGPNPRPDRRGRLGGPNELVRPIQFTTNHAVGVASHKRRGPPSHVRGVRFCAGPQRHGGHKRPAPHGADHIQFVVGSAPRSTKCGPWVG